MTEEDNESVRFRLWRTGEDGELFAFGDVTVVNKGSIQTLEASDTVSSNSCKGSTHPFEDSDNVPSHSCKGSTQLSEECEGLSRHGSACEFDRIGVMAAGDAGLNVDERLESWMDSSRLTEDERGL